MTAKQEIGELENWTEFLTWRCYVLETVVTELCKREGVHGPYLDDWRKFVNEGPEGKMRSTSIAERIQHNLATIPKR